MDLQKRLKLNELIVASIDNDIAPEGFGELQEYLRDDPEAQEYYARLVRLFVVLKENRAVLADQNVDDDISRFFHEIINDGLAIPAIRDEMILEGEALEDDSENEFSRHRRRIDKKSVFSNFAKFAAVFVIFLSIVMADYWVRNKKTDMSGSHYLGRLSRTMSAQWDNVSGPIEVGTDLYAGPMSLKKGLAEIVLNNGAEIIIEGPCEFKLENEYQLFLDSGSLVANIENSTTKRLVVRTNNATVVDYGTEFGVMVDRAGNTTTQVFQGCVELREGADPFKYSNSLRLEKDQGGQVNPYGSIYNVESKQWTFIRREQFNTEIKASEGSVYHKWKAYSYKLRRRQDLVAYYTFENIDDGVLPNMASLTSDSYSGKLQNMSSSKLLPSLVKGRWPEKNALSFNSALQQYVYVKSDDKLNINGNITTSAWIKLRDSNGGGHILSNRLEHGAVNYQLAYNVSSYNNRIQFLRYAGGRERVTPNEYKVESDEWHFIAASHDNQTINYYIDGELVDSRNYEFKDDKVDADLFIGSDRTETDMFNGVIGEVAIFNSILSDSELKEMYEKGHP